MSGNWRKYEKALYLPSAKPQCIEVPPMQFFTISGQGNPDDHFFAKYVEVLYAASYAIKMSPKKAMAPEGYSEYTVYPLEGVWRLADKTAEGHIRSGNTFDKNALCFDLMIRQPEFVTEEYASDILAYLAKTKPLELLPQLQYKRITEGCCVQMLHIGRFDDEHITFAAMNEFCQAQGVTRTNCDHREIYLSDPRRVAPEKMKTVLRFAVALA